MNRCGKSFTATPDLISVSLYASAKRVRQPAGRSRDASGKGNNSSLTKYIKNMLLLFAKVQERSSFSI